MENQQSTATPPAPTTNDAPRGGFIGQIFLNDDGLRAGWRLLMYVGVLWRLFPVAFEVRLMQFREIHRGSLSPSEVFFQRN